MPASSWKLGTDWNYSSSLGYRSQFPWEKMDDLKVGLHGIVPSEVSVLHRLHLKSPELSQSGIGNATPFYPLPVAMEALAALDPMS